MSRPVTIKLFGALLNVLTFLLVSVVILFLHNWYQSGDTYALLFWTIPLAAGLAISGGSILQLLKTSNKTLRIVLIFVLAVLISLGWLYVVGLFWGSPFIGFDFALFYLWIAGSFIQLLFLDRCLPKLGKTEVWKIAFGLLVFPVIVIVLIYLIIIIFSKFQ
jgi:hypothetical protein